ncbi:MAG: ABC transporter permease [Anaerolineaceae bacterium]|nr:ABC transporter permease [Anaerolineaceae bacterium]
MISRLRHVLEGASIPVAAVLLGLVVSSAFVAIAGKQPLPTYAFMFCEGFGARGCESFGHLLFVPVEEEDGSVNTHFAPTLGTRGHKLAIVLERATPLILTALSATVAFRAGMFSIGQDGQLVLGAVAAVFLGYWLPDQIYLLTGTSPDSAPPLQLALMRLTIPPVAMAAAMLVGAFYSWIAGILKVRLNVNELISTIILNAIAVQFVTFMVNFPLRADFNNIARTRTIDDTAWLTPFTRALLNEVDWFRGSRLGIGLLLVLVAALIIWFFLHRTTAGYEQRMTEGSRLFARYGGIPSARATLRAMLISGALSGLAGALMILGVERRIVDGFTLGGVGFDGVLVAILACESVVGILLVASFFAGLEQGAINLQFENLPRQLGGMIIAFMILFASMEDFFRDNITRLRVRLFPRSVAPSQSASEA